MKIVIGSGPAGIACAHALHGRGEEVLLVDAGIMPETSQATLLERIGRSDTTALAELSLLHSNPHLSSKGVVRKLVHGSDYPYQGAVENLGFDGADSGLLPSLARGGLSNVWGAAVMPYRVADMVDWPIQLNDLVPNYEAALRITGLAARRDGLAEKFPLYCDHLQPLDLSSQAKHLLAGMEKNTENLRGHGIIFGTSRLAVGTSLAQKKTCVYCGKCLHGCPYGCIYNSAVDVDWLLGQPRGRFTYRPDCVVETVSEANGGVVVAGFDRLSREPIQLEADRVFVAAGVIPTTRIMLKSLEAFDHDIELKDSQYFVLPCLSSWSGGDVRSEALHTLSQLFLEFQNERVSPYTVHLQLYTYNDIIEMMLRKKLWFAPGLRQLLIGPLCGRIVVLQGYLHSVDSGTVSVRLSRDIAGQETLAVRSQARPHTGEVVRRAVRKLKPHLARLGLHPIPCALEITRPGRGFHCGGGFPMRHAPKAWETDTLGRPAGMSRVHLADASTFPSIPATTITLTAMANAHRMAMTYDSQP